jgi:hypothetical protein
MLICTIVAVDGDNADFGLCGVSSSRRIQPQLPTEDGVLVTTFPHLSQHLAKSVWASRGWTYQEAVLSRRCLFFTSDQVYFACRTSLHCEAALQSSSSDHLGPDIMNANLQFSFRFNGENIPPKKRRVGRHLKEYTSRSLTFDSDVLNAFKGILSAENTYAYHGLPFGDILDHNVDSAFAWALAWRSTGHLPKREAARRRESRPTWSWTSLVSQIECPLEVYGHGLIFFVEDQDKQLIRITDFYQRATKAREKVIPERSKYLHIEGHVVKVRLQSVKESGKFAAHPVNETLFPHGLFKVPLEQYGHSPKQDGEAFLDLPNDETLHDRLHKEEWNAVQLSWARDGSYWMLLDWIGSTAHRIGLIKFEHRHVDGEEFDEMRPWIPERRTIRIE